MKTPLETLRHSAAHILAQSVLDLYPGTKLGMGPCTSDGFFYDFDMEHSLNTDDLIAIEKRMQEIIKEKQIFNLFKLSKKEAIEYVNKIGQEYKTEIIEDRDNDEFSFYENGSFVDLCKGPHLENTGQIPAFKLLKVAGAYWKGSEKNKMLQRIYGTAFFDKKELRIYINKLEEAKKRDHRILGKELDLFSISDDIGPGLVLWHPKGARIRHLIEDYWKKEHFKAGYELLYSPHIGREQLWQTSGHLDFYKENMYSSINVDNQNYFLKPMNCPFHIEYYNNKQRSYRELPIRVAELGTVYRYERSGTLHGLLRVRGFTQDDAHIICTPEQLQDEILKTVKFSIQMLNAFGFNKFDVYLATKPEEKFVGDDKRWEKAEDSLKNALETLELPYSVDEGGGAFYGPKIDIKIEDAIGRAWQCSTIQFDFNLPDQFDMSYIANDGTKSRPYMIHRALLGAIERFMGVLIEHFGGKFPLWLAPTQVKILSIADTFSDYCKTVETTLKEQEFRTEIDISSDKIGYKIRNGIMQKIPYLAIIGQKEVETNSVSVRSRDNGDLGTMSLTEFDEMLKKEMANNSF
jgi:threonyl-tRNA synthetase